MKYEDTLQIEMLGEFSIRNEFNKFPQELKKHAGHHADCLFNR